MKLSLSLAILLGLSGGLVTHAQPHSPERVITDFESDNALAIHRRVGRFGSVDETVN